jgi:hypothetical protein
VPAEDPFLRDLRRPALISRGYALNQSMSASIVWLRRRTQNTAHPIIARRLCPGDCRARSVDLTLLQESLDNSPYKRREIMKALIAALALVTLVASPTFAQTVATDNGAATCYGRGFGPSSPCYP